MSVLSEAIKTERWELASLCLLLGLARVLSRIPADSLNGLLEVLEGEEPSGSNHGR